MDKQAFVNKLYPTLAAYAETCGYNPNVVRAMVAQAACESSWGESALAAKYNNYFGMKCGSSWTGRSVNLSTNEEYNGQIVNIKDNFRVFNTFNDGIDGYFQFLKYERYAPLKECNDPESYIFMLKECGWATSSSYVSTLASILKALPEYTGNAEVDCVYKVGYTGTLKYNMKARSGPGQEYPMVGYENLTADGKAHDKDKNGCLDAGTRVTIKEVVTYVDSVWIRIPSGWICAKDIDKNYVEV